MLLNQLKDKYISGILDFLWRQWSQLGVAGNVEFSDRWVIDPEALLLFTLDVGRYDSRLFDEVIDWGTRNCRWLSIQRLINIAAFQPNENINSILASFAEIMWEHERSNRNRWTRTVISRETPKERRSRTLVKPGSRSTSDEPHSLFLDHTGLGLPALGSPDPVFHRHGWLRKPVNLRGMSRTVPVDSPPCLLFKLRQLFGLGARAEVVAYLLTNKGGYPNEVAKRTYYSAPSVQLVMGDLVDAGFIRMADSSRDRTCTLDPPRWRQFLKLQPVSLRWVDWGRAFAGLSMLTSFLMTEPFDRLSDYMLESRLRSLVEEIGPCFADTGLEARPQALAEFRANPKQFHTFVTRLLRALNPESKTTRPS